MTTDDLSRTGLIALFLSFFFAVVTAVNAYRRKRQIREARSSGPVHITDPHSGTMIGPPTAPASAAPPPDTLKEPPSNGKKITVFRQLDSRGVELDAHGAKHDEYRWE